MDTFKKLEKEQLDSIIGGKGIHSWKCAMGFGGGLIAGFASLNPYIFAAATIGSAANFCS